MIWKVIFLIGDAKRYKKTVSESQYDGFKRKMFGTTELEHTLVIEGE